MKRNGIIVVAILGILIVTGLVIFSPKKSDLVKEDKSNPATTTAVPQDSSTTQTNTSQATNKPSTQAGKYEDYSSASLASTTGKKVLFFHAPWCPQCKALDASIKAGQIPTGVTIFKVDYDSNQALRQKYGVTIQTTLVQVNDSGALVKKYNAYSTPSLDALVNNVL